MNDQTVPASRDGSNAADEVKSRPPTFTPLKIGADGGRIPYDSLPSFGELRADLFAGKAVVIMPGVDLRVLYAKHAREDDRTAFYDNAQPEYVALIEAAAAIDPDIGHLWLDVWSGEDISLCLSETENGQPELSAA